MVKQKFKCYNCGKINEFEVVADYAICGPKEFCEKCEACKSFNTFTIG